ncbi:MAG: OmpA family protein [Fibromonadaceae bacterium]|jgi:outer membrane protein OmpA-like peptidoglycan-associated protein|nr:OmpA family protein [Fibromonadaceae bacterium]
MKKQKIDFFWISYSDLMTSLFFIMLVLFVLAKVEWENEKNNAEKQAKQAVEQYQATQKVLDKIMEIEKSVKNIDSTFFKYDENFKRYTLKGIEVKFETSSSNINDIDDRNLRKLGLAGKAIEEFINKAEKNVKYQLIIEGQTSKDNYSANDQLSYERALSLFNYWQKEGVGFDSEKCEVVISGSGYKSLFRDSSNTANQRFVIHIIPKIDYEEFSSELLKKGKKYEREE